VIEFREFFPCYSYLVKFERDFLLQESYRQSIVHKCCSWSTKGVHGEGNQSRKRIRPEEGAAR
jgi:hypothetical protein